MPSLPPIANIKFDPNAVDFEPILVSGSGRILTYHTAAYRDDARGGGCRTR